MLMSCSLVNGIWCSIFKMQFQILFESLVYGVLGRSFIKHSLYLLIVFSEHNFTSLHSTWCWLVFLLVSLSTLGQPSDGSYVLYVISVSFFSEKVKHWIEILMRGWSNLVVKSKKKKMGWFFFSFSSLECDLWHFNSTKKKTDWSVCILHCMFRITKRNKRYFWWWKCVCSIIDSKSFERDDKLDESLCKISIFEENP